MKRTKLRPYQFRGAKMIRSFGGRALLADEMGLGKTLQALFWCFKTKKARPIIVVCPSAVKWNWAREASMHLGLFAHVLEGRKVRKRHKRRATKRPIIVINYDILVAWLPFLKALDPKVVIVDECHYIKNPNTARYKAVKELCDGVRHVIGISGTPLTNRPAELWPMLNILLPKKFDSFFAYAMRYARPKKMRWGWTYGGAKNLEELHRKLTKWCMIRRLKKDVLKDLPPKVRIPVPVTLGTKGRMEYEEASSDFIKWLGRKSPTKAKKARKAEAMTRIGYLHRLIARRKLQSVYEWIDNFLETEDGKLVVMTQHRPMIRALQKRYGKKKIGLVTVDGSVTGKERQKNVDRFQTDAACRLFLGNMRAAGVGITLTAAQACLFTDLPWTPGDLSQAEDRIHRFGQKGTATIYYLIANNTIEMDLCDLLLEKQKILEQTLNGAAEDDESELDVLSIQTTLMNRLKAA